MENTERFQRSLGAICDLMCHPWLRKLFVAMILEPQCGTVFSWLFQRRSYPTIKEWRWGKVMLVLRWLFTIEIPFRRYWTKASWVQITKKQSEVNAGSNFTRVELDLDALDDAVLPWFWSYARMLHSLQEVLHRLQGWGEDCSCCCWLLAHASDSKVLTQEQRKGRYARLLNSSTPTMWSDCPCKGLRASEYAAGDAFQVFDDLALVTEQKLAQQCNEVLSEDDVTMMLADLHRGLAFISAELYEKLKFWLVLPWLFAGLMHPCEEKAAQVAHRIVQMLKDCEDHAALPRLAQPWLEPTLFTELQALADRSKPRCLLKALVLEGIRFMFIPTTERPIETPHAMVNLEVHGRRKCYPVNISFANRMPEIESRIECHRGFLGDLSKTFCVTRMNPPAIATALKLQHHPAISDLITSRDGKSHHVSLLFKQLVPLVYHTHPTLQFMQHPENKALQLRGQQRRAFAIRTARKRSQTMKALQDDMSKHTDVPELNMMHEHFRHLLRSLPHSTVISLGIHRKTTDSFSELLLDMPTLSSDTSGIAHGVSSASVLDEGGVPGLTDDNGDADWAAGLGGLAVVPQPAPDELATVFFTVQDASPVDRHTMPIAPSLVQPRSEQDIVLSMHKHLELTAESAVMCLQPSPVGDGFCNLLVSSGLCGDPDHYVSTAKVWAKQGVQFSFAGEAGSNVRVAATELYRQQAWPHTDVAVDIPRTVASCTVMAALAVKGYVMAIRETSQVQSWQLTSLGVKRLQSVQTLRSPKQVFAVRDVPLVDMTRWELMRTLVISGWAPYAGTGRMVPVNLESGCRVFAVANAHHSYLLALCHGDQLLAIGQDEIKHRQRPGYYNNLLQAIGVLAAAEIADTSDPPMVCDGDAEWPELLDGSPAGDGNGSDVPDAAEDIVMPPPLHNSEPARNYPRKWGPFHFVKKGGPWVGKQNVVSTSFVKKRETNLAACAGNS